MKAERQELSAAIAALEFEKAGILAKSYPQNVRVSAAADGRPVVIDATDPDTAGRHKREAAEAASASKKSKMS